MPGGRRLGRRDARSARFPHQLALAALPIAFLDGFALVVRLLALGEAQRQLADAALVEEQAHRHKGHAVALDRPDQLVPLLLVDQQLSQALGLVLEGLGRVRIFRDMDVEEVKLPSLMPA